MNSTSEDIKTMLEADSNVEVDSTTAAYPIHIGFEPSIPAQIITIIETQGFNHPLTLDKTEVCENTAVQIIVRSNKYVDGWALASSIKTSLHGRANETCNGTFYMLVMCENGPAVLDRDQNQRFRFIMNFNVKRR